MEQETQTVTNSGNNNSKNKVVMIVVILVVLAIGGYFVMKGGKTAGTTDDKSASVATVNGVVISKTTFDTQLASTISSYQTQGVVATSTEQIAQIKTQVLNNLIDNEVLNQAVKASGVTATSADVEKQYQALVTQAGGVDKLQAQLVTNKMTEAQLRENIGKQLAVQTYLLQNIDVKSITVTDAEVSQFYAQYSAAQKAAGATVPALKDLSAQIKQQITSNKEQVLVTNFIATLRTKATVTTSATL